MDSTGLKVYDTGEYQVKKHGNNENCCVWCKLHLTVDMNMRKIIAAEFSSLNATNCEVLLDLHKQSCRRIDEISGDGACDTDNVTNTIRIRRTVSLILPVLLPK
ncbi:transposase [Candidatus Enterovibrio altilux]|uniref:transposase n=1 Tax=Candidatus Enterovibrio altilux TaxID=1927128 RepID=UPI000E576183|nr:transposase [Candidatus Enterovibrio luxaltus]